jgi:hypothetical protein
MFRGAPPAFDHAPLSSALLWIHHLPQREEDCTSSTACPLSTDASNTWKSSHHCKLYWQDQSPVSNPCFAWVLGYSLWFQEYFRGATTEVLHIPGRHFPVEPHFLEDVLQMTGAYRIGHRMSSADRRWYAGHGAGGATCSQICMYLRCDWMFHCHYESCHWSNSRVLRGGP